MALQFQGVPVHTLPGAREGRPDGLHPFLEPAAPALEDPEPNVGPGLPEKREVNTEPVVFPCRRTALAQEVGQPPPSLGREPARRRAGRWPPRLPCRRGFSRYPFGAGRPARARAVPAGAGGSGSSCSAVI